MNTVTDRLMDGYNWNAAWISALVALAIRAFYLLFASHEPTFLSPGMDAELYRNWADAMFSGPVPNEPFYRAPFYPSLIAGLGAFFGDTFWPVRILQTMISAMMAGGLAFLAGRWFGTRAAWFAGLGWALYGTSIYFDGEGLIASLFTSGVIGMLILLDSSARKHWTFHTLQLAILAAAMCALRANALVYTPALIFGAWWAGGQQHIPYLRRSLILIASTALAALLLMPILSHNARYGGGWSLSTQGGINLFLGNHSGASGAYAIDPDFGPDWTQAQTEFRADRAAGRTLTAAEVSDYYVDRAISFWQFHPGLAISLTFRKILALVNWRELGNNRPLMPYLWHTQPLIALLMIVGFPLITIIGLVFSVSAWRKVQHFRPAILIALIHGLVVIAFFVNARYRFPLTPVLILLFAYGLDQLLPGYYRKVVARRVWILRLTAFVAISAIVLIPRPIQAINQDGAWQLHRANALLRLDRIDEAREAFIQLLSEYPNARHGHLNLGVIELQLGNLTEARFQFEAELGLRPESAMAWNNLVVVQEQLGNPDPALLAYRRAIEADQTHDDARLNLLRLLTRQASSAAEREHWELALSLSSEAVDLSPNDPQYAYNHAVLLAAAGLLDDARTELQMLLAAHPEFQPTHDALQNLNSQPQKIPATE